MVYAVPPPREGIGIPVGPPAEETLRHAAPCRTPSPGEIPPAPPRAGVPPPRSAAPVLSRPVGDLLRGFLFGHSREGRARRRRDLDPWFAFCASFAIDVLSARSLHVAGFASYEVEVRKRARPEVEQQLLTLWKYYRHAQAHGAVATNPVTTVIAPTRPYDVSVAVASGVAV
ncbi:MAG: hypothetical protein ACLPVF_05735 [Acidimicrobiales bacterium]